MQEMCRLIAGFILQYKKNSSRVRLAVFEYLLDFLVGLRKPVFAHLYKLLGCFELFAQTVDVKLVALHPCHDVFKLAYCLFVFLFFCHVEKLKS